MRQLATVLFLSVFATSYGCQSNSNQPASSTAAASDSSPASASAPAATPNPSPANAQSKVDACTLLTSAEVQAVQGEPVKATKASQQRGGELITDLCYYELPTPSNSISLALTYAASGKREDLRDFWENTFAKAEEKGDEKKKPDARKAEKQREAQRGGEEEEEGAKPEKISGLGDEAFWLASRVGGALYVLKGDRYFRISIGGAGNNETKLNKSKNLAKKALARL
jgi:hypothetical protein